METDSKTEEAAKDSPKTEQKPEMDIDWWCQNIGHLFIFISNVIWH